MHRFLLDKKILLLVGLVPIAIILFALVSGFDGFPLGDIGAHIGEVYLIEKYGYLQPTLEWENGEYLAGIFYFPLSYFFGAAILKVLLLLGIPNALTLVAFGVMILSILVLLYISVRGFNSWLLGIAFVSLTFFNKISINILIESTRYATIFSYIFFLLFLFLMVSMIRKNEITFKDFVILSVLLSLTIMAYANVGLGAALIFATVFLLRKELWKWFWVPIVAFLPNMIWITPYITEAAARTMFVDYVSTSSPITFVLFTAFLLAILVWIFKGEGNGVLKKVLLVQIVFYSIILVFKGIIPVHIPQFNKFVYVLHLQNLGVITFFFLTKKLSEKGFDYNKALASFFILLTVLSAGYATGYHYDIGVRLDFADTECKQIDSIAGQIKDPFVIYAEGSCSNSMGSYILYNYGKVNYLSPIGYASPQDHTQTRKEIEEAFESNNCEKIREIIKDKNINSFVCSRSFCEKLQCLETHAENGVFKIKTAPTA